MQDWSTEEWFALVLKHLAASQMRWVLFAFTFQANSKTVPEKSFLDIASRITTRQFNVLSKQLTFFICSKRHCFTIIPSVSYKNCSQSLKMDFVPYSLKDFF